MIHVFGSVNLDLVATLERLPAPGETVGGGRFATAPGGKGANQALAARRAGADVALHGAVGRDANAVAALALLDASLVDLLAVRRSELSTGVALILVDGRGENVIAVAPGANSAVSEADAAAIPFAAGDVLLLQMEVPAAAMGVAARRARGAGALVVLNLAPFAAEGLALLPDATHLVLNETECAQCAEALGLPAGEPEAQARAIAAAHGVTVVVTLGAAGVVAAQPEKPVLRTAALTVKPVDTVGAGDTFCGFFGALLGEGGLGEGPGEGRGTGMDLAAALRLAAAAGSLACTKAGAQPSIPLRAEVEAALGEFGGRGVGG